MDKKNWKKVKWQKIIKVTDEVRWQEIIDTEEEKKGGSNENK